MQQVFLLDLFGWLGVLPGIRPSEAEVVDYKEFVAWLTNRSAQYTVGTDGWMTPFDLKTLWLGFEDRSQSSLAAAFF